MAPTACCAAGVAGTDPIKTTNLAFLFSAPVYVIPFIFVYRLGLLLHGSVLSIAVQILAGLIGILCLVIALQGYFLKELKWVVRLFFAAIGLVMLYPHWISDVIGYCLIAMMAFYYFKTAGRPSSGATKAFDQ